jgi:hypothetical protein
MEEVSRSIGDSDPCGKLYPGSIGFAAGIDQGKPERRRTGVHGTVRIFLCNGTAPRSGRNGASSLHVLVVDVVDLLGGRSTSLSPDCPHLGRSPRICRSCRSVVGVRFRQYLSGPFENLAI